MTIELERDSAPFTWSARELDSALVVSLGGDLDLAVVPECAESLEEPLSGPMPLVVFDLSELDFADSTGLRFLIDVKRRVESIGKRLQLCDVSQPVLRLFESAGLTSWFDYLEGHGPVFQPCVTCDREIVRGRARCPHCNGSQ